uniref:tensin homologue isoform X2 n=1 Tax=Ciona intestinalis TaxID=7719 RepID=UPI000EF52C6B|nr:tensin homologue isoform X2 [Ciona intestinalis]|eukprot:XP_026691547.1 tensin homologue isoform X2 [Ciona intestinalis]
MKKSERPLSLPPSPSPCDVMTPTSPIETSCCRCRRAKSVNSIFLPRDEPKKKSPRLPKLTWSVFKAKDKGLGKANIADKDYLASQDLSREAKSTSWRFVPRDQVEQPKPACGALFTGRAPFVITPIATPRQSKQAVPTDPTPMTSLKDEQNQSEITLRRFVLTKESKNRPKPGIRKIAHVPRSPGPLDGSLYAQVKKNKKIGTDDSDDSTSLINRDYEEIDQAKVPLLSSSEGAFPPGVQEGETTSTVTSPSHHGVDLLRDVTNASIAAVQGTKDITSSTTNETSSENLPETTPAKVDTLSTTTTITTVNISMSTEVQSEKSGTVGDLPRNDNSSNLWPRESEVLSQPESEKPENMNCDVAGILASPPSNVSQNDMESAMALVNEFLMEEKLRTPNALTPNGSTPDRRSSNDRVYPEIGNLDGYMERGLHDDSPDFEPPLPNYPAPYYNPKFQDKSPEYALPDRDVILGSALAKSAVLVTARPDNSSYLLNQVNNHTSTSEVTNGSMFVDSNLETGGYSTIAELTAVENMLNGNHKDSLDSGHSLDMHTVSAPVQKATSSSDIDSGIDGSAMAISSAGDLRPSPKLARNSVPLTSTSVVTDDCTMLNTSVQTVDVNEKSNENNNGNFFSHQQAVVPVQETIHFQPIKEADVQFIRIKNVYKDSESNLGTNIDTKSPSPRNVMESSTENTNGLPYQEEKTEGDVNEEEEELRVQEEIENTRKRLLWLQEQQSKIKLKKEEKIKRNSYGYSTSTLPTKLKGSHSLHLVSSTLPRPPHHRNEDTNHATSGARSMTAKEKQDIDELLRSVQELDLAVTQSAPDAGKPRGFAECEKMVSTMASPDVVTLQSHQQHSYITQRNGPAPTTHSYITQRMSSATALGSPTFTPAYAHPMHHPEHMQRQKQDDPAELQKQQLAKQQAQQELQRQQQQELMRQQKLEQQRELERQQEQRKQEELTRARMKERQRESLRRMEAALEQQQRKMQEQRIQDIKVQEEKRQREREEQERFQLEFEMKQRQMLNEIPEDQRPKQQENSFTSSIRKGASAIKRDTKPEQSPPATQIAAPSQDNKKKTDQLELQNQLDELDMYIAQLSQNFNGVTSNQTTPAKSEAVLRRRRSFSIDSDRKMETNVGQHTQESQSSTTETPPRPPSRTRSSYDSVSRRLSHGFELAQLMRQNSIGQDSKDTFNEPTNDDVFSQDQNMPQPSYPPRTSHTRPPQQQMVGRSLSSASSSGSTSAHKKSLEERLSPQLFLAMSVNPGGRPIEDIHSYKEDLEPDSPKEERSPHPATPAFPITPKTPYTNLTSPIAHVPIGITKTPLSELGLKPKPLELDDSKNIPGTHTPAGVHLSSAPKQHQVTSASINGTTQGIMTQSQVTSPQQSVHMNKTTNRSVIVENSRIRLDEQTRPTNHQPTLESRDPSTQQYIHGSFTPPLSQTTSYTATDRRPNGWQQNHSPHANSASPVATKDMRSPWVFNGDTSPIASSPAGKSPVISSIASSATPPHGNGSGEVSPAGTRSLNGSNDSLLSGGSASGHHPHLAYQKDRYSHNIPKDSSRHSASSIRSTSTGGSGYLGGASQTSPHSAGSPVSGSGQYPFTHINKRESQLSAYDRHGGHHLISSDEGGLSSPASGRTSASSVSDIEKLAHEVSQANIAGTPPKFIKDTTAYWYKPEINRDQAHAMLRTRPPGSFVVRASRCYPGAFGLALKVHQVPAAVLATAKPGTDMNNELVRHFLIEPSTRGVKLKGCPNEPVFGSLSALIYQHSITPLALPCKLVIPTSNQDVPPAGSSRDSTEIQNSAVELLKQGAACNVLYLGSEDTESLTGPEAIERAMRECMQNVGQAIKTSVVHFKVSPQGITLTDNARKIFFRRHYPTATVTYCGLDPSAREPHNRRWDASKDRGPPNARVFGFVAKKPGSSVENVCHLFAELDLDQPAPAIVNFVSKVLIGAAGSN